jgi:hypothetical protein
MIMILSFSLLGCKFCHSLSLCVANCNGQIYYVVHKHQSMSRVANHFGVHNHLIVDGKCQKSIKETRRLITKEVDHTPNAKISSISFSASKTFLASYLLDDFSNYTVDPFKGK